MTVPREVPAARLLASVALFKALPLDTLARLGAATLRRPLRRGEFLFLEGEPSVGMYVVVYGEIKLLASTPTRGTRLSGMVRPGQSFGEPVMFLERSTLVAAQAASDALVLFLPREVVFSEIENDRHLAHRMIAGLSRRIEGLVQELDRQASSKASQRLVAYLLRLAGADAETVVLPATKAEIASQLGLTPEHFSRVLRELAAAGLLRVEARRITLLDRDALDRLAPGPQHH